MTTYGDIKDKVLYLVKDAAGRQYSDQILFDGVCSAHDALVPWVPKLATELLVADEGENTQDTFVLPTDLYQIDAVQDVATGRFVPRGTLAPRTVRNFGTYTDWDYVEYPTGYIYLSQELDSGDTIKVYYRAYWKKPTTSGSDGNDFRIEVPAIAHTGLTFYAASYAVLPRAIAAGGIRQYNTSQDSGNPVQNPLSELSDYLLKRFLQEMKMMPPYTKAPSS